MFVCDVALDDMRVTVCGDRINVYLKFIYFWHVVKMLLHVLNRQLYIVCLVEMVACKSWYSGEERKEEKGPTYINSTAVDKNK